MSHKSLIDAIQADLDEASSKSNAKGTGPNRPTATLISQFADLVERGNPFNVVCDYLGIPPSTFNRWIRHGKFYNQNPEVEPKYKIYGEFEAALRKAGAAYYVKIIDRLHSAKNWQRELAILERRDRKNFAKFDVLGGISNEELDPDERFA